MWKWRNIGSVNEYKSGVACEGQTSGKNHNKKNTWLTMRYGNIWARKILRYADAGIRIVRDINMEVDILSGLNLVNLSEVAVSKRNILIHNYYLYNQITNISMKQIRIFYSWQSDVAKSRQIIKKSIQDSVQKLKDKHGYDIIIDEGTRDVPGAPSIDKTIFEKIDICDVFVCDVTPIAKFGEKEIPNPNVMTELGYALARIGESQVVFVAMSGNWNHNFMPFDIRNRRIGTFNSEKDCNLDFEIESAINHSVEHRKEEHVGELKDYVQQDKIIPFSDALTKMTNELIEKVQENAVFRQEPTNGLFNERYSFSLDLASAYLNCVAPIIRWIKPEFEDIIIENIDNFINRSYDYKSNTLYRETVKMNYLTDFIMYYGIGTLCVYYKNYSLLNKLLKIEIVSVPCDFLKTEYAVCLLKEHMIDKELVGKSISSLLGARVRVSFHSLFKFMGKEEAIEDNLFVFERLKSLYANHLFYNDNIKEGYIPFEECEYRIYYFRRTGKDIYEEFFSQLDKEKENSAVISQGLFDKNYELYQTIKKRVESYCKNHRVFPY